MNKSELLQKKINLLHGDVSKHKSSWEEQLPKIRDLLQILAYQIEEEFISVHSFPSHNEDIENFEELKDKLCNIIEDEILGTLKKLKDIINNLKYVNSDMKNRIDALEKLSSESYEDLSSEIMNGNERQPSLSRLLQLCLNYRTFFLKNLEKIVKTFDNIDMMKRGSVKECDQACYIDLNDTAVTVLMSSTEYIN